MGLFSRKKKVELPEAPSDDLLDFPKLTESEKEIVPEKIQREVGLESEEEPELIEEPKTPVPEKIKGVFGFMKKEPVEQTLPEPILSKSSFEEETEEVVVKKPFFSRIQSYQETIESLSSIKISMIKLEELNDKLDKSRFNENRDYETLKRDLKNIHDKLLFMDDLIFKQ